MSRKRKVYSASFRAQVALTAARGDKTVNEIAAQFEVSPQMVLKMKARLKDRIEDILPLLSIGTKRKRKNILPLTTKEEQEDEILV